MQPIQQEHSEPSDLQESLNAYYDKRLGFDQLRTQWILALAENPQMCSDAVRLLYQQPPSPHLTEAHTLSLKRIVEAAEHDGPEDWTVVFENEKEGPSHGEPLPAVKLVPGHVLKNRFVLEEKLGSGGVGIVFRARDRLLQRAQAGPAKIALKVLREEFRTNPELLRALQREAGHAQQLSHPNIVRVYDFHQDGGTYFLTMELLKGQLLRTLLARLARAPVSRERAIRIITGMCRGLAYAHEHGLVHADFKPGNVILTEGDEPKILDFGLAQAAVPIGQRGNGSMRVASNAPRAVTPAYASCNRMEGGPPGFSDDVYSLSCVIYELLSGRHPYNRKSALVVRAMDLQPSRIDHLTDVQWRTLATGLKPAREHRTTQVHDLQVAFSPLVALQSAGSTAKGAQTGSSPANTPPPGKAVKRVAAGSATRKPATIKKVPAKKTTMPVKKTIRKKRRRSRTAGPILTGLLLGAVVVALAALLIQGIQRIPAKYIDSVRDSELLQTVRSTIGLDDKKPTASGAVVPVEAGVADDTDAVPPISERNTTQTAELGEPAPGKEIPGAIVASSADAVAAGVSSGDSASEDKPVIEISLPVSGLAADDAAAAGSAGIAAGFRLDASEYIAQESSAALALEIMRQGDLSDETRVEWTTYEDTAQSTIDYVGAFRNVVFFGAGESTKTIYVPIVSDANAEMDETFRIALSRPGGNMVLADPFTATVTIVDDDF